MVTRKTVRKTTAVTYYGGFTLDDLREFVRELDGVDGASAVTVTHDNGGQRDTSSTVITVRGVGA